MRSRTQSLLAFALFALATMTACERGEALRDLGAGKIAPPEATLVREYAQDENFGNKATYVREYRTALSPEEVLAFFTSAFDDSWRRSGPSYFDDRLLEQYIWRDQSNVVIVAIGVQADDSTSITVKATTYE